MKLSVAACTSFVAVAAATAELNLAAARGSGLPPSLTARRASAVNRAEQHVTNPESVTAAAGLAPRGFPLVAGVRGGGSGAVVKPKTGAAQFLKIASYFFLWYAFNVVHNISNKEVLNSLPLPWTTAVSQLGIGLLFVFPAWLLRLRKAPKISRDDAKSILPIAVMHTTGHVLTVVALGAGTVSVAHMVKAAEPFFSTVTAAVFLKTVFRWQVYATLFPIVCGVALASVTELSFSWASFLPAVGSNTAFALRSTFSKKAMTAPRGKNMNPPNLYAVVTAMSFLLLLPVAALIEGPKISAAFEKAIAAMNGPKAFWSTFLTSGLSYYLYNEMAFLALSCVHPITHAVGNTIKRVVIMLASVAFLRTPMHPMTTLGSAVAIFGTLLYWLAKLFLPNRER